MLGVIVCHVCRGILHPVFLSFTLTWRTMSPGFRAWVCNTHLLQLLQLINFAVLASPMCWPRFLLPPADHLP